MSSSVRSSLLRSSRYLASSSKLRCSPSLSIWRAGISTSATRSDVQFSGTLTNIIDDTARPRIQVKKLTAEKGFHLSDGLLVPGGVIFLDNRIFLWDVDPPKVDELTGRGKWEEWSEERFEIFEKILPRPEILLLGTGLTVIPPPLSLRNYLSKLGIQVDIMDSVSRFYS